MGLSIHNIELMMLTSRKADIEYRIAINSMEKMALARSQTDLTQEYYSKLQSKDIVYYANGQYNRMDYGYLMGYSCNTLNMMNQNPGMLKSDNSMILTDASGLVVLGSSYVSTMTKVLGSSCMDSKGRGSTFSAEKIPELIAAISSVAGVETFTADEVRAVMNGGSADESSYTSKRLQALDTGNVKGTATTDNTNTRTNMCQQLIDFYEPIFKAAAANGWTTEYNNEMEHETDYINAALTSGFFQLAQVDEHGNYNPDTSLTYFTMSNLVTAKSDSSKREEVNAWYNKVKEEINFKESLIDMDQQNLSTELESINTKMEDLKSMLKDKDMSPFEWCT